MHQLLGRILLIQAASTAAFSSAVCNLHPAIVD
jgi:hypothetical protein